MRTVGRPVNHGRGAGQGRVEAVGAKMAARERAGGGGGRGPAGR